MFSESTVSAVVGELLKRRPFVPFEVIVADGRAVRINTAEQAWLDSEVGALYVVSMKPADTPATDIVILQNVSLVRVYERMVPDTRPEFS